MNNDYYSSPMLLYASDAEIGKKVCIVFILIEIIISFFYTGLT